MDLILTFHGVGVPPAGTPASELPYWCEEGAFAGMLDAIVAARRSLLINVAITFDDGNASDVESALPALIEYGLTASFFVCAGRIGARGYLDAPAIRELLRAGMTVGSHGMDHADWSSLSGSELDKEIADARWLLGKACGREVIDVAVPFGRYNRRVLKRLKSEGLRHVYTSDGGLAVPGAWIQPRNTVVLRQGGAFNVEAQIKALNAPLRRVWRSAKRVHRMLI